MSELTRIAPLLRGLFLDHAGVAVRVCSVSQLPGPPELSIQFPGGLPADDQSLADQLLQAYKASGLVGGRLPAGVDIAVGQEKYYFQTGLNVLGERAITGRVALVTGGAQGFGAELVRGLVQAGAFVYVADLNIAGANELCAELGNLLALCRLM